MKPRTTHRTARSVSDLDLMLAVEHTRRRNRVNARHRLERHDRERDLWSAYLVEAPTERRRAANEPPPEVA